MLLRAVLRPFGLCMGHVRVAAQWRAVLVLLPALQILKPLVPAPCASSQSRFPPSMAVSPLAHTQIRRAGFKSPTPIQAQAWPIALSGRDIVAIAKTGSGKTCGFLLPGMLHIQQTRKDARVGPTLLVLAPTRELAMQIKTEADKFGRSSGIRNTCVYGGAPKHSQLRDLQNGVQIVIATPGRLNDFLEGGQVRLQQVGTASDARCQGHALARCLRVGVPVCAGFASPSPVRALPALRGPSLACLALPCLGIDGAPPPQHTCAHGPQVSYLVLDEADRMLDMGFEPQIQRIVRTLPRQRQTLFFSATWPREVKQIASQFVVNQTVHVFIGGVEEKLVANKAITQIVKVVTNQFDKMNELGKILRCGPGVARDAMFATLGCAGARCHQVLVLPGGARGSARLGCLPAFVALGLCLGLLVGGLSDKVCPAFPAPAGPSPRARVSSSSAPRSACATS